MDIDIVERIHQTPFKFYCAITGGGQSFIGDFCKIEGASNNLVGAFVPYNQALFDSFVIGKKPDSYVSSEGARKLAVASFNQCLKAGIERKYCVGIGASSSIVKKNERQGRKHKIYIAVHCYTFTSIIEVILSQEGLRSREQEDSIINDLIFQSLAHATLGKIVQSQTILIASGMGESFSFRKEDDKNLGYLINNETDVISSDNLGPLKNIAVYAGSFAPLHESHLSIKSNAEKILNQEVFFELSTHNKDKGFIDYIEVEDRLKQFNKYEFILTNLPKFTEKFTSISKYAPTAKITFVMGQDTFERIEESDYDFFIKNNVKFLVFPRGGQLVNSNEKTDKLLIHLDKVNNIVIPNISSSDIRKKILENI